MARTWILATSVVALGAVALIRRWRRRQRDAHVLPSGQAVSPEWLSNARGRQEDTW